MTPDGVADLNKVTLDNIIGFWSDSELHLSWIGQEWVELAASGRSVAKINLPYLSPWNELFPAYSGQIELKNDSNTYHIA